MRDPLHVLLLLSDERSISGVLEALRQAGYDVRAGYAHSDRALLDALARRRWDAVIGDVTSQNGHIGAAEAGALLTGRPAAAALFALHPTPTAPEARSALEAGARAVLAPDALARLGAAVSSARTERRQRRRATPPPRRPLAPDVADHLPIGVYQTTSDGQFVYANAALAALLGAPSAAALVGQHAEAYGYPRQPFLDAMQQGGAVHALDSIWTRPDGRRLHTREHARAVRDETGAVRFYEGTLERLDHQETSDRYAATATRRDALLAFHTAADRAETEQAIYGALRHAAESLLGLRHVVVLGRPSAEKVFEPDAPLAVHAWSAAISASEQEVQRLASLVHADGDGVYPIPPTLDAFAPHSRAALSLQIPRETIRDGRLVALLPAGRRLGPGERADARRLAAQAGAALDRLEAAVHLRAQSSTDRLHAGHAQAVADLAGYGLALGADGQVRWWSAATAALIGASPQEQNARGLIVYLHPSDRRAVLRAVADARQGRPAHLLVRTDPSHRPAGAPTWMDLRLRHAHDGSLHVYARDASTERAQADERQQALDTAHHERRFLTSFLSHAGHQLRTPLTSVIGFAQVLAEETEGESHDHARLIETSSHRLADQLSRMLALARPHPADAELRPVRVDVGAEARETLALLEPLAHDAGLRFEASYPKRAVEAEVDREAFARLLYALLGPAISASGTGRIRAEVARRGGRAVVTVAAPSLGASGPDGDPDLASARTIAAAMGIRLTLSVRPGGLATASLRFPLATTAAGDEIEELLPADGAPPDLAEAPIAFDLGDLHLEAPPEIRGTVLEPGLLSVEEVDVVPRPAPPARPAVSEPPAAASPDVSLLSDAPTAAAAPASESPLAADVVGDAPDPLASWTDEPLSVLAVEDNEDNRLLLERFVGDGIDLDTVSDARTALSRMAQRRYDVLLIDINLGRNQSGADVLRIARTLPGYADVYAIAFTAHDGPEQLARFAAAGFDAHLGKPFSRASLREVVAGAVST